MSVSPATQQIGQFHYSEIAPHSCAYLLPAVLKMLPRLSSSSRVLDVGCGNGAIANAFLDSGCHVVGIDVSSDGIEVARRLYGANSRARFEILSAGIDMLEQLDERPFDLVVSTEVIEHLYNPAALAKGAFDALRPGGCFICSTPYHGYLKNLALAATGSLDQHFEARDVGGHIKFWSRRSLSDLFREVGFRGLQFRGAGRVPLLWKSMLISGSKPGAPILS